MTGDYNPSRLIDYNSIALGSTIRLIAQFSFLLSIVLSLNFRFIGRRGAEFDRIITRKTVEIARLGNAWKNEWKIEKKELARSHFIEGKKLFNVLLFRIPDRIVYTRRMASKDSMNGQSNNLPLIELINSFFLSSSAAVLSSPSSSPSNLYTSSTVITIQGRGNRKFSTPRDKRN